jgi:nitrogen fixation/metabolism regulation signal transduction histidine kinase
MNDDLNINTEEIFTQLNATKVLIAILDTIKEISIPTSAIIDAGGIDRELQVDYNSEDQTFTFKVRETAEPGNNDNELITDFE